MCLLSAVCGTLYLQVERTEARIWNLRHSDAGRETKQTCSQGGKDEVEVKRADTVWNGTHQECTCEGGATQHPLSLFGALPSAVDSQRQMLRDELEVKCS